MFNIFENAQTRLNDMCEGFGYCDDIDQLEAVGKLLGIKAGSYQTVMLKPVCGFIYKSTYFPLRHMPIDIESELADNDAPSVTHFNTPCTAANTSVTWRIQNFQIKCDILSLDNSYVNILLGGDTLQIVYDTFISSVQSITSADTQVNVSRSLTALRSVFMSLDKTCTEARIKWCNKSWNTFYSNMLGHRDGPRKLNNEIQHLQLMVGSKMYPEYPIIAHAECSYNLRNR